MNNVVWIFVIIGIVLIVSFFASPVNEEKSLNISTKGKDSIVVELTGVHIPERKAYILNYCNKSDIVKLEFEPTNKFDEKAIMVFHDNFHIGYIAAVDNEEVGEFMRKYSYHSFIYKYDTSGGFIYIEIGLVEK